MAARTKAGGGGGGGGGRHQSIAIGVGTITLCSGTSGMRGVSLLHYYVPTKITVYVDILSEMLLYLATSCDVMLLNISCA